MSWLSLAYEFADDSIPECPSLAEVGGVAFAVDNVNMRKVYAGVGGAYLELMTGADADFDASGWNRYHFDACAQPGSARPCRLPSLLGPSQGPGIQGNFGASEGSSASASSALGGLSTGLVWSYASDAPGAPRRSLANRTLLDITAAVTVARPQNSPASGVAFSTSYVLWEEGVLLTEAYAMAAAGGGVNVTATLAFPGQQALFAVLVRAAAAAAADSASTPPLAFYSPPADAALAKAVASGDLAAFVAAAPPHPAAAPTLRTLGVAFPAMTFDGLTNYTVRVGWRENAVLVQLPVQGEGEEGALSFGVTQPAGGALQWSHDPEMLFPSRNGLLSPVYAEVASPSSLEMHYQLEVVPWQQ